MKKLFCIAFLAVFAVTCSSDLKPPVGVVEDRSVVNSKHVLKVRMEADNSQKFCVVSADNFGHYPTGKRVSLAGENCNYVSLNEIK